MIRRRWCWILLAMWACAAVWVDSTAWADSNASADGPASPDGPISADSPDSTPAQEPPATDDAEAPAPSDEAPPTETSFMDEITVRSASRRAQRIVEAPAAVTLVQEAEIERDSASGQLPKLLEFTPGAELAQSGLYDFKLNVRGFNTSLGRRVLTLIDGRDVALPSLGVQEWGATSFPLDDLESIELVRGPGSALYGADAFNGVLNMTTKAPRDSQGGQLRLTAGELSSFKVDLRHADALGPATFLKVLGSFAESDDFARSRNTGVEYSVPCTVTGQADCVLLEAVPLRLDRDQLWSASLRLDHYFRDRDVLTVEAGTSYLEGPVIAAGVGRTQMTDVERPWIRANYNTRHWNVLAYLTARDAADQLLLSAGTTTFLDEDKLSLEIQGNTGFGDGRGTLIGGVSYIDETVDTADPRGVQTLSFEPLEADFQAVFGQIDFKLGDRLTALLAARWDDSSLHSSRFSPRGSLVYALNSQNTLRLAYSEAFQTPNYAEFFQAAPIAPPVDLSPFEAFCTLGGTRCGFEQVPVLAVGNEDLEVEEVRSIELGYSGVLNDRAFLTVDLYDNRIENFITDLIGFNNATLGGAIHDNFPAYRPPAELAEPFATLLLQALAGALPPDLFGILSNAPGGSPIFTALSHTNFARVKARGLEIGLDFAIDSRWSLDAGYAYFDFDVDRQLPDDPVLPNNPSNKFNLGLTYTDERLAASLNYRYSESFEWSSGLYLGPVPSYDVVDFNVGYRLNDRWRLGIDVSNLLDSSHFEIFGGDLLARRALGHVAVTW
ncbi:MAG: TonB-dependent receptor [Acidobacteriota bacterium]